MQHRFLIYCLLVAIPVLAGAKCAFFFSTGDSDPRPKDPNDTTIAANVGHFVGTPVRGVAFKSGSISGLTGENGEFQYEEGRKIRCSIGDIRLGREAEGRDVVTPIDLVEGGSADDPAVINIARLLQSLDAHPGDDIITIPTSVGQEAVTTNRTLYWALNSLDFGDEQSFVNAASALVAVLTRDYPFTATLVDADTARARMLDAIETWNNHPAKTAHSE